MRRKRILSLVLCLCMALSLLPSPALAAEKHPFTDVSASDWFNDSVQYVFEHGLMNGTDSTTFAPYRTTQRGMIVTILYRLEGSPTVTTVNPFNDVPRGSNYENAIIWAAANGIVTGYNSTTFGPYDNITRQQMAAISYRYAQMKGYRTDTNADLSEFTDSDRISSYARTAMAWANGERLINGNSNKELMPTGNATRAQAAAILTRFCENVIPSGEIVDDNPPPTVTYDVTFDLNYSGEGTYQTLTVKEGDTVTAPTNPTRSGYNFNGWYTSATGGTPFKFNTAINADTTLYARWSRRSSGGGGGGTYSPPVQPTTSISTNSYISIINGGYSDENPVIVTHNENIDLIGKVNNGTPASVTVTYRNYHQSEQSANVTGTIDWTSNIPLEIGTNVLNITARDEAGHSVSKEISVNRVSDEIVYSDSVKMADESDYSDLKEGLVACWIDDNETADDETDDTIVLLTKEDCVLLSQIRDGLLIPGNVYMIPENDMFVTGFTGKYQYHQAPHGTEEYPIADYPDTDYEEIIFTSADFSDIFDQDISIDFTAGVNPEHPIAFAILADGTRVPEESIIVDNINDETTLSAVSIDPDSVASLLDGGDSGNSNSGGGSNGGGSGSSDNYPSPGWQPEELAKNALPALKVSIDNDNRTNIILKWGGIVIYDKDGVKTTENDQLKLSGQFGIEKLYYTGCMEWHPSILPWNFHVLPQQIMSKVNYDVTGTVELKGEASLNTEDLVKKLNQGFENKAEFWGMTLSGVDTLKTKWVVFVIGIDLTGLPPVTAQSINSVATVSLTPKLILCGFIDINGNLSVEGSVTFGYETSMEKGFNIQQNGYTGSYGSQAQNRSDKHYTIGNDHTLDVYDTNDGHFKLSLAAKADASIDVGVGAGAGLMLGGIIPAMINGEVFYRASGQLEGSLDLLPEIKLDGSAAIYNGIGVQADLAAKLLVKTKIGSPGFDFSKHWEHMFWERAISTSSLSGVVYVSDTDSDNSNNEKIEGANVTLKKNDTGDEWTTVTNQNGEYKFQSIPDGTYTIRYEKEGFDSYTNSNLIFSGKAENVNAFLNRQNQTPGICTLSGRITIADEDTDQTNNLPLEGADISIANHATQVVMSTTTAADGTYQFTTLPAGNYTITISKPNYITILEAIAIAENTENYYNATIEAISNDYIGIGSASGTVYDALNGYAVPGLTLRIRDGIGVTSGAIVVTVQTDASGRYAIDNIQAGNYSVEIVDERTLNSENERYYSSSFTIKVLGGHSIPNQDGFVTNGLTIDQMRIVLRWGSAPKDLDSHLVGPASNGGRFHTYWDNQSFYESSQRMANLDLDDTDSYGPETTTIYEMIPGIYTYMVHDYTNREQSGSDALANSGAYVEVYLGNSSIASYRFNIPNIPGNVWTVFTYDSQTGKITPVNTMSDKADSSQVGSEYPVSATSPSVASLQSEIAEDAPVNKGKLKDKSETEV